MPWTLYRYIFKDLVKLLVLSTAVLVFVIAFAASIKPLADGLLGPLELVRFLLFTVPTMLPFALPFAGAFASTLVYCRLTGDNEVLACRAAGMGYGLILAPALVLGLVLMVSMFVLSNYVVPSFYRAAEAMVQKDLTRLVVSQVQAGRPVRMGGLVLYADAADGSQPPPVLTDTDVQPFKLVMLRGVAVGQTDKAGRIRSDSTAERADALFFRDGPDNWVTLRLTNVMLHRPAKGELAFASELQLPQVRVPSAFRDNPRFLSRDQMRRYAQEPERFDRVRGRKERLAQAMALRQLTRLITQSLVERDGRVVELAGASRGEQYHLTAPLATESAEAGAGVQLSATADEPVRVDTLVNESPRRRMDAKSAAVRFQFEELDAEPRVVIELQDVLVRDVGPSSLPAERSSIKLPAMHWPQPIVQPLLRMPIDRLTALAARNDAADPAVARAARQLAAGLSDLSRKIIAQGHERGCLSLICLLTFVLGATLSMRMAGSMPLVVFIVSFVLALLAVIVTYGGDNVATEPGNPLPVGLAVIWSGAATCAAFLAVTYWKLSRN